MNKKSHSTLARSQWRTYSPSPPSKQVTPAPLATPKMQRAARHAPGAAVSSWSLDQCPGQRKLRVLGTRGTLDTERISNRSKSPESSMNLTCSSGFRLIPPFRYHTALVRVLPPQTPAAPANSSDDWAFSSFYLWSFVYGVMHTMGHVWRSEKMCESWFSPPTTPVAGIERKTSSPGSKHLRQLRLLFSLTLTPCSVS